VSVSATIICNVQRGKNVNREKGKKERKKERKKEWNKEIKK
jgi:hypothetical protein